MNPLFLLAPLLLAQAPDEDLVARVDAAVERGVDYLLAQQYPDGSFYAWTTQDYVAGPTTLCTYAMLKSGLPADHPAIRLALEYLRIHPSTHTYEAALRCLLLDALDPKRYHDRIDDAAAVLLDVNPGLYTYVRQIGRTGGGDMSNTQYAMVALESLDRNGWKREDRYWQRQVDFLLDYQLPDGSFSYNGGGKGTHTMTLAGYSCLAACQRVLQRRKASHRWMKPLREGMSRAEAWLDEHWVGDAPLTDANGLKHWVHYAWYGMERAMGLADRTRLGSHDWYPAAANALIRLQHGDGSWSTPWGERTIATPFSLLTLSKATASTGGRMHKNLWEARWNTPADSDLHLVVTGAPESVAYLSGFSATVRKEESFPGEPRPRVLRLDWYLDGQRIDSQIPSDPVAAAAQDRAPRWEVRFPLPTDHVGVLVAEAWIAVPGGDGAERVRIRSLPLELRLLGLQQADYRRGSRLLRRMLSFPAGTVDYSASSEVSGSYNAARRAFDREQGTRWLAGKKDTKPWIALDARRPLSVSELLLLPALTGPRDAGFDLPTEIQLTLNSRRKEELRLEPTAALAGEGFRLRFPRPVRLRKLEVRILARDASRSHSGERGRTGFREILFLGPED